MKRRFEMFRSVDRLAALLLFILLLAFIIPVISITRYLPAEMTDLIVATDIQEEIQDLQEMAGELQETIDDLQVQGSNPEILQDLEMIDQTVEEINDQLEQIGDELEIILSEDTANSGAPAPAPSNDASQSEDSARRDLLSWLGGVVGILSIPTAIILAIVMIWRGRRRKLPLPY